MTAELILLISLYAFWIMGVFLSPANSSSEGGLFYSFQGALPSLSARIELHVATGHGFWGKGTRDNTITWEKPDP